MIVHTTVRTEVKLDHEAVEEVFKQRLDEMCGGDHIYIDEKTGKVMSWDDTGHGSGITDEVENPSERQIAALKFRDELNRIRREQQKAGDEKLRKEMRKKGRSS